MNKAGLINKKWRDNRVLRCHYCYKPCVKLINSNSTIIDSNSLQLRRLLLNSCLTCLTFLLGSISGKINAELYGKDVIYDISLIKRYEEE